MSAYTVRVVVMSWDWREQPDLEQLDQAVRLASGGLARVHTIDTGSDEYAIVVADHRITQAEAEAAWQARWDGEDS